MGHNPLSKRTRMGALLVVSVSLLIIGASDTTLVHAATVKTPTFSPPSGTYPSPQNVTILCNTTGATIRYTTNGSEPTSSSTVYSRPIIVSVTNTTIKAKAFATGMTASPTSTATYTLKVATPDFWPKSGTYSSPQNVIINCSTPGAIIKYTLDGSEPRNSSTSYSNSILVNTTNTIINAKAFKNDMLDSETASVTYIIKVATPTFDPPGGTYSSAQNIVISCVTSGAAITYTTNGSDPTPSSTVYSVPIILNATTTVKAKAFRIGMTGSDLASATYTINLPKVAKPTFTPGTGTYSSPQSVTIQCATPGATITYTVDNSDPSPTSNLYSGPILVSVTTTIKARAFKTGMTDSDPNSAIYTINLPQKVATPTFDPTEGTYPSAQTVTIQCTTSGATIRYTVDGTEPTSSSNVYSNPISVIITTTIRAKAFKSGWTDSEPASATYVINLPKVASPTFGPSGGSYSSSQNVAIRCSTEGATIRYTTDGSEPTSSSTIYLSQLSISFTTTVKAKAFKVGMIDSEVVQATYTISIEPQPLPTKVSTPTFNPAGGAYSLPQTVTLSCATSDATIRYTLDASEPSSTSPVYSTPILVSISTTIKARAFKSDMVESDTASETYTIYLPKVSTPTFSPESGSYSGTQSVVIRCATPSAMIRFTTDGSEPSPSSLMYSGPIQVAATTTIKAKAFMFSGMTDSDTASATFTINAAANNQAPVFGNEVAYAAIATVGIMGGVAGGALYWRWGRRRLRKPDPQLLSDQ